MRVRSYLGLRIPYHALCRTENPSHSVCSYAAMKPAQLRPITTSGGNSCKLVAMAKLLPIEILIYRLSVYGFRLSTGCISLFNGISSGASQMPSIFFFFLG
jgi:hypothetical protein